MRPYNNAKQKSPTTTVIGTDICKFERYHAYRIRKRDPIISNHIWR